MRGSRRKPTSASGSSSHGSDVEAGTGSKICCGQDPVLGFFCMIRALTIIVALLALIANIAVLATAKDLTLHSEALRAYNVLFCLFIIFTELELRLMLVRVRALENWGLRGIFYSFVGLATLRPESEEDGKYKDYEDVVGFVMIGVGVLYFVMGLLCLRAVKENREELVQLRREDWQFHHRHGAAVA